MISSKADLRDESLQLKAACECGELEATNMGAVLGVLEKRSEALLRIVPVALAGGGSVTQATQIDEWLDVLGKQDDIIVRQIGVASPRAGFADEQVTDVVYFLDRSIRQANTVSDIYHNVSITIAEELRYLYSIGIRHFTAVCCGYTSYGLFALHQAIKRINASYRDPMTGNVIIQDSSFPDTDVLCTQLDQQGYPLTRFYGPAYQSSQHLRILFALNGAIPFDVALSKRCPPGCTPIMTALPYTPRYIACWQKRAKISKIEAKKHLARLFPALSRITPLDYVIPLVASGGCWEEASVGKWMTCEQFLTVEEGTLTLVNALRYVSKRTNKRIFMPLIKQGTDFVLSKQVPDVYSIEQMPLDSRIGVIILPYDTLPQPLFIDLLTGSDLVVHRTVQTNSFAETIVAQTPLVVITIPAAGYMDAEMMVHAMNGGLLAYNQDPAEVGAEMYRILTQSDYRDALVNSLQELFTTMYSDPETNFGMVLARVAGLNTDTIPLVW